MIDFVVRDYLAVREAKVRIEGLTVVRGESYSGKSSMFRAIEAAMSNRFASGCVRWGSPQCSVSIRFGGGGSVLKVSKAEKSGAVYTLGDTRFEKVGRNVPSEVQEFLGCGYLRAGSDVLSLNFWEQFSKPLLWSFSQVKISDMLGNGAALQEWSAVNKNMIGRRSELKGAEGVLLQQVNTCGAELGQWQELGVSGKLLFDEVSVVVSEYDAAMIRLDVLRSLGSLVQEIVCVDRGLETYGYLSECIMSVSAEVERVFSLSACGSALSAFDEVSAELVQLENGLRSYGQLEGCLVLSSGSSEVLQSLCNLKGCLLWKDTYMALDAEVAEERVALIYVLLRYVSGEVLEWDRIVCADRGIIGEYKQFEVLVSLRGFIKESLLVQEEIMGLRDLLVANMCPFCGSSIHA